MEEHSEPKTAESSPEKPRGNFKAALLSGLIVLLLVAGQAALVLRAMDWSDWTGKDPVVERDYAYNYYNVYAAKKFYETSGRLWGYDPYFMAGYPAGTLTDVNNKMAELLACLLAFAHEAVVFKMYCLAILSLGPLLIYHSARNFGLPRPHSLLAASLLVLVWNSYPEIVHYQAFGMVSFLGACYASVWVFSLLYRALDRKALENLFGIALLVLVTPLLFSLHVIMAFLVFVPGVALAAVYVRKRPAKTAVVLGLWAVIVVVANLWWIGPMWSFKSSMEQSNTLLQTRLLADLGEDFLSGASWYAFVTLSGLAGVYLLRLEKDRGLFCIFLAAAAVLLFLGYHGSWLHITSNLEPKRFKVAAAVLLAIPAAFAFARTATRIFREQINNENLLAVIIVFLAPVYTLGQALFAGGGSLSFPGFRLTCRLPKDEKELVDYLRRDKKPTLGCVAFEDRYNIRPDETLNLSPLLPILTGRRVIGGPNPRGVTTYNAINFFEMPPVEKTDALKSYFLSQAIFPRKNAGTTDKRLSGELERMDVDIVVARSAPAVGRFNMVEEYRLARTIGPYSVFERKALPGDPRVEATYDRITVTEAPDEPFVLPLNYVAGFVCDEGVILEREWSLGDTFFMPLIKVRPNGSRSFELRFKPSPGDRAQ